MKKRSVSRRIFFEPFQYSAYVACGAEELLFFLKEKDLQIELGDKPIENLCGFMQPLENEDADVLVYFAADPDLDTIGHECLHLVHEMMEDRGVPINKSNSEIMAYLQEYIVYEVKKALVHREHLPKGSAKRVGRATV